MGTGAWVDNQHPRDKDGKFASGDPDGDLGSEAGGMVRAQINAYKTRGEVPKNWNQGLVGHYSETNDASKSPSMVAWNANRGLTGVKWTQQVYSFEKNNGESKLKTVPFGEIDKMLAKGSGSKEHPWDYPGMKAVLEKHFEGVKPKSGESVIYRLENTGSKGLNNKNAGNLEAVITFASSQSSGTRGHNITAYSVKIPRVTGQYEPYRGSNKPQHARGKLLGWNPPDR
jgi:hypothetical protein